MGLLGLPGYEVVCVNNMPGVSAGELSKEVLALNPNSPDHPFNAPMPAGPRQAAQSHQRAVDWGMDIYVSLNISIIYYQILL